MPQSTAALSASAIKRAAKLMAGTLKSTMPPPLIQNLISNPALLRALVDELSLFVGGEAMKVTAGRRQIVFLGNTGPNNGREWVVIQYRNRPNGNGENVMRISQRLGREPTLDQPVQWTDPSLMGTFLRNMRPKLSRPGVMLMNKLVNASVTTAGNPFADDKVLLSALRWERGGASKQDVTLLQKRGLIYEHPETGAWQLRGYTAYQNALRDAIVDKKRRQLILNASTEVRAVDQVAQEMADEWRDEMEAQLGPMGASASTRVQAGTWQEQAKAELEAELGGIETEMGRGSGRDYFTLETMSGRADNGESEWMVFKDSKAAERYAIEYVNDMLEDDASMFDQKWLKQHVTVSPTDIRVISQEDADAYVDNIRYESDERVLDEAGMLRAWQKLDDQRDKLGQAALVATDPREEAKLKKQFDKLVANMEKLVEKADQKLRDMMAKQTADALKKDPLGWAEELGFDIETNRPPWLQIDTRKAAADAVKTDGVAHFLDSYDGDEVDLKSGAVAFGTN